MQLDESRPAKRCLIYARVSTEEQTERFGISSQLSELRNLAAKAGYEIAHELIDEGYSGADLARPALSTLRELVRTRGISLVLVHDPDRLARRLAHQLLLTEEFERAKVRLEFVTTPNSDSMEGRLLLNVRGVIAEYEREKIRERTMRGRREKARQGLIVGGRTPYGYDNTNGVYTINEAAAQTVTQIFRWLVEDGLSIRQIIESLNDNGSKPHSSTRWAKSSVSRILRNEIYIGRTYYNRRQRVEPECGVAAIRRNKKTRHKWRAPSEWITQSVPAILSTKLFQAAQAKLRQNSAHCSGRPAKAVYLLRGILKCPLCGRKCYGTPMFGDIYYRCVGRERLAVPRCTAPSIAAKTIEPFVWNYVIHLLLNPELLAAKLAEQQADDTSLQTEEKRLGKLIHDIEKKEERLLEALLDGDLALPGMRLKAKELERQKITVQRSFEDIHARLAMKRDQTHVRETVLSYCRLLGSSIRNFEAAARQKLLRAILDDVIVRGTQVTLKGILPTSVDTGNRPQCADDRAAWLGKNDAG